LSPHPSLVVEPNFRDVLMLVPVLTALGFQVTATKTFEEARQSLRVPPRLLITEIRLGEFNGLHLVLRGLSARQDMAAIVTSTVDDLVLRAEAEALGATFVLKPSTTEEMRAVISRTVFRGSQNLPIPIRAPFERRTTDRRATAGSVFAPERRSTDRRVDVRTRLEELALH
jgi:DNA-binding response OmpR family regulator